MPGGRGQRQAHQSRCRVSISPLHPVDFPIMKSWVHVCMFPTHIKIKPDKGNREYLSWCHPNSVHGFHPSPGGGAHSGSCQHPGPAMQQGQQEPSAQESREEMRLGTKSWKDGANILESVFYLGEEWGPGAGRRGKRGSCELPSPSISLGGQSQMGSKKTRQTLRKGETPGAPAQRREERGL